MEAPYSKISGYCRAFFTPAHYLAPITRFPRWQLDEDASPNTIYVGRSIDIEGCEGCAQSVDQIR